MSRKRWPREVRFRRVGPQEVRFRRVNIKPLFLRRFPLDAIVSRARIACNTERLQNRTRTTTRVISQHSRAYASGVVPISRIGKPLCTWKTVAPFLAYNYQIFAIQSSVSGTDIMTYINPKIQWEKLNTKHPKIQWEQLNAKRILWYKQILQFHVLMEEGTQRWLEK